MSALGDILAAAGVSAFGLCISPSTPYLQRLSYDGDVWHP